jgi:hypothetical protein
MVRRPRHADDTSIGSQSAAGTETIMSSDADWVADVRRWYLSGQNGSANTTPSGEEREPVELGYEAAHPALQSRHWPDAPRGTERR